MEGLSLTSVADVLSAARAVRLIAALTPFSTIEARPGDRVALLFEPGSPFLDAVGLLDHVAEMSWA